MSRKGRGQDRKGRSRRKEQYIGLPHKKVKSAAWRALSGNAIKVYLELHSRYWGGNNGKLSLSLEEGARVLGLGKATVKRALEELEDKGFVAMTRRGHFYGRRASEYRLTGQPIDRNTATRDWENWTPDGAENSERGSDTDPSVVVMGPFQNRRVADGSV